MKRITASLHISLDGFAAGPNGEMNWIRLDEALFDYVKNLTDDADTALYGRVTWQMMEAYWPEAGNKPGAGKHDKEHSEWYNKVNKVVISESMKDKQKAKTTFISGNINERIRLLKRQAGKNIVIFGSPSVVRNLMTENLIDEYWLFVNPVILGKGISIFGSISTVLNLELITTKQFDCGVTLLRYKLP